MSDTTFKTGLTAELAREVWTYDPETGDIDYTCAWASLPNWEPRVINRKPNSFGYVQLSIPRELRGRTGLQRVAAHRVGFLIANGWLPEMLDHRDRIRHHNWLSNLRPATREQNNWNRNLGVDNTSGFKGVHRFRDGWMARVRHAGEHIYLGVHSTPEGAARAYDRAALQLHGPFALTNEALGRFKALSGLEKEAVVHHGTSLPA